MCVQEKNLNGEKNSDVGVCPKWREKVRDAKRSPFKKIHIEDKAEEIYQLFQDYIECPVSVGIQPMKDFPGFSLQQIDIHGQEVRQRLSCGEKIGPTIKYYPIHKKAIDMTHENTMLLKITMDVRFLRKSSDQLLDLIEFILYSDKKSKQKVIKTFAGPSFAKSRRPICPYTHESGKYFDLTKIGRKIEKEYFSGVRGTYYWGRQITTRRMGLIQLHGGGRGNIIINPAMDAPEVPEYVIEQIIFHELLHAFFHDHSTIKLRSSHEKRFRDAEKTFPKHNETNEWVSANWRSLVNRKIREKNS